MNKSVGFSFFKASKHSFNNHKSIKNQKEKENKQKKKSKMKKKGFPVDYRFKLNHIRGGTVDRAYLIISRPRKGIQLSNYIQEMKQIEHDTSHNKGTLNQWNTKGYKIPPLRKATKKKFENSYPGPGQYDPIHLFELVNTKCATFSKGVRDNIDSIYGSMLVDHKYPKK